MFRSCNLCLTGSDGFESKMQKAFLLCWAESHRMHAGGVHTP